MFVPLAEETGLARQLGSLVLRMVCAQAAAWAHVPDLRVWVNVSTAQLEQPGLAAEVRGLLEEAGLPPERLGIEVTESALADERSATVELTGLERVHAGAVTQPAQRELVVRAGAHGRCNQAREAKRTGFDGDSHRCHGLRAARFVR